MYDHRRSAIPALPRSGEVDACKERREHGAVDGNLRAVTVEGGQLEAARFESLRENAPAGAVEPKRLREPSSSVEEEVEVPVDGV